MGSEVIDHMPSSAVVVFSCRHVWYYRPVSIRQRMNPTVEQATVMGEHCQMHRFMWNLGLEQRSLWSEQRRFYAQRITAASQMRELTELRAALEWVGAGSTVVQQGALRDVDRAFRNFFAGTHGFPTFKKRTDRSGSFVVRDVSVRRINHRWGTILIPKVGHVRFRVSRPWGEIAAATSARVTLRNNQWHVAFTTPPKDKLSPGTGTVIGIDRGVTNTIATSDGGFAHIPGLTAAEQARFAVLQRRLSRQRKGSARRVRTLDQLATLRRRLDDRRTDWIEQTTTALAREYDMVVIEALPVRNMVRRPKPRPDQDNPDTFLPNGARAKAGLNRAIHASCWGALARRLANKTGLNTVDPRNTSRMCHACGHTAAENRESQADFACVNCGHTAHADTNAARNIRDRYLASPNPGTPGDRTHQPRTSRVNHQHAASCAA